MANWRYEQLKPQEYLTELDTRETKILFRFRTRRMNFNGSFKGQGTSELCPLCGLHDDLQAPSFKCPKVLEKIQVKDEYGSKITPTLSKTLSEMAKLRGNKKNKTVQRGTPDSAPTSHSYGCCNHSHIIVFIVYVCPG